MKQIIFGKPYRIFPHSEKAKVFYFPIYAKEKLENILSEHSIYVYDYWKEITEKELLNSIYAKNIFNITFISEKELFPFIIHGDYICTLEDDIYYCSIFKLTPFKTIIIDNNKNTIICHFFEEEKANYQIDGKITNKEKFIYNNVINEKDKLNFEMYFSSLGKKWYLEHK